MNELEFLGVHAGQGTPVNIESPTVGVVLVSAHFEAPSPAPLHWRVGDWSKPPIDISIDPLTGALQSVQLVLQDERVPFAERTATRPDTTAGVPLTKVGNHIPAFRDVRREVTLERTPEGYLVATVGDVPPVRIVGHEGYVLTGWDGQERLCQLLLGPLSAEEWSDINAFSGVIV